MRARIKPTKQTVSSKANQSTQIDQTGLAQTTNLSLSIGPESGFQPLEIRVSNAIDRVRTLPRNPF